MNKYLKLMRVKHYIKNFIVFIPLFFAGEIFNINALEKGFLGFICFCLTSSAVYILNDIQDVEKDRNHPKKKNRPIASGAVKVKEAYILMFACLAVVILLSLALGSRSGFALLVLYFMINVAYSMGLKNKPIIDIVILASGFVIRLLYGGAITGIVISGWLYLVVVTGSLYMALGKRRNELKQQKNTREVLKFYSDEFLDKNMYVCVSLVDVFYALWTMEFSNPKMVWTVPIFIIIMMCYSLDIESGSDGDPVEVILQNKTLLILIAIYTVCIFSLLYVF